MTTNISFGANRIALYKSLQKNLNTGKTKHTDINIYMLTEKDVPFLEKFRDIVKNKKINFNNKIHKIDANLQYNILNIGLFDAINALKVLPGFNYFNSGHKLSPICLIAEERGKFKGLLVGNLPSIDLKNNRIVYSSRNKLKENEIEYLGSFAYDDGKITKGIGATLISEFFEKTKELQQKVNKIFLNAALPSDSPLAVPFYEKLGFKQEGKPKLCFSEGKPIKLVDMFINWNNCKTIGISAQPMSITIDKALETSTSIRKNFEYLPSNNQNVDLNKIITVNKRLL